MYLLRIYYTDAPSIHYGFILLLLYSHVITCPVSFNQLLLVDERKCVRLTCVDAAKQTLKRSVTRFFVRCSTIPVAVPMVRSNQYGIPFRDEEL